VSPFVNKGYTGVLMKTYEFIVVGGGIAGGSIAYELARTSRVCLFEAEARTGFHATGRAMPNLMTSMLRSEWIACRAHWTSMCAG
jgi:glycine/D-amino acid oxidase-like deaminating enzyme